MVGLLLVAALFWVADFQKMAIELRSINPLIIVVACILQIVTIYLVSLQWYLLAKGVSKNVEYKSMFHVNMVGTFVEAITPAVKAGGEAAKVVILKNSMGFSYTKALSLISVQKVISVVPFLMLSLSGTVWFLSTFTGAQAYSSLLLGSFFFLLVVCLILVLILLILNRFSKVNTLLNTIKADLRYVLKNKEQFVLHMFLSFGIWIFFAVKAYYIANALGLSITFLQIGVITYLTYMVAMVPLTPGGLGTFEASMVLLLAVVGIPFYQGIVFALVFRFSTFWFVFIWSGIYLLYNDIIKGVNKKQIL